jgi:hypothetical protein
MLISYSTETIRQTYHEACPSVPAETIPCHRLCNFSEGVGFQDRVLDMDVGQESLYKIPDVLFPDSTS